MESDHNNIIPFPLERRQARDERQASMHRHPAGRKRTPEQSDQETSVESPRPLGRTALKLIKRQPDARQ